MPDVPGVTYHVTHRSLLRACDGPSCHCPAPLSFLGAYLDLDLKRAGHPCPFVGVYLCRSCDQVIEVRPARVVTYRYSTSCRPRRGRAG